MTDLKPPQDRVPDVVPSIQPPAEPHGFAGQWISEAMWITVLRIALIAVLLVTCGAALYCAQRWGGIGWFLLLTLSVGACGGLYSILTHRLRQQSERRREQGALQLAELRHRALQLETLVAVNQGFQAILDEDVLLTYVADTLQEQFGYYYVSLFRFEPGGEYIACRAGSGPAGRMLTRQQFHLKVGEEGLIGWVAQQRRPLCVNDVSRDARYVALESVPHTRAELVLPLLVGDELLGVLDIEADRINAFAPGDVQVFQSLADQVARALHNVTLYQREYTQRCLTERLHMVSRAISQTLDTHEVLDLILSSLRQILSFDRGSVLLQRDDELEIVAALGFPPDSNPLNIRVRLKEDDVFAKVARTKSPLVISDLLERSDWQQLESLPQSRAWAGIPLINAEDLVTGMLSLVRERPIPFTHDEIELALTFAGQTAVALQNAILYSKLADAYAQLERLDRTKSDFITVTSHELRTPLTLIKGFSQLLHEEVALCRRNECEQIVQGICDGAGRMQEIVEYMLDIAEIDSRSLHLHLTPVSLPALLAMTVEPFMAAIEERRLRLHLPAASAASIPLVEADADALRKVFTHLIGNAIKYTPDGGEISLSVMPSTSNLLPEGGVEVVVSDTGIGIDPRYHDVIFLKFYQAGDAALHSSGRTKFKGGGPGLGLAIVRGILECHNGHVWVESPGYDEQTCPGSQFHVLLPYRQPQHQA